MKSRRSKITASIRDGWITEWALANERSPHFVPFSKTQDIKSAGSKSRTPDFEETGQDRDFYSTNERHFLYRLRFSKQYLWIKEQYPLLPLARTLAIAKEMNIRHPTYPYTANVHVILTSDFYCKTITGDEVVYSIKDIQQLTGSPRKLANLELKLKLERVFWESQGVKWHLITSDLIKDVFSQNLEQLYRFYNIEEHLRIFRPRWTTQFDTLIQQRPDAQLHVIIEDVAKTMGLSYHDSVAIFLHCLWHKLIIANLNIRLRFEKCVSEFSFKVVPND